MHRRDEDPNTSPVINRARLPRQVSLTGDHRVTATFYEGGALVNESYAYDGNNRLTSINRGGLTTSARSYDAADRVTQTISYSSPGVINERRDTAFNINGWMTQQQVYNAAGTNTATINYTGYDAVGNLASYNLQAHGSYTNYYSYTYARFGMAYREQTVSGSSSWFQPGQTNTTFDVNGNVVSVSESFATSRARSFVNDLSARVLRRVDNAGSAHFTYVDGNPLASTNAAGNFDNDYNYTPVNERYPGASPGSYVVSSGDTLRAIALAVYGDARLWFLIAQANGLSGDADLRAGQTLNVPNRVTNLFASAQTVRPYSPGEIVGDTTPTLPDPPPPPPPPQGRGGCGGFGQVLVMVVSIAVAIAVPAMAGVALKEVGLGLAMMSAAAGNVAGVQKGFNFRSLAMSVASAGIGHGIFGGGAPGAKTLADRLLPGSLATGFAGAAFNAAAGSLLGQGAAILVGAQQRFDWRTVAAAAVGGSVSAALGSTALGPVGMIAAWIVSGN